jgi:hypothetical protein
VQPAVAVKVKTGAVPAGKVAVNCVVVVGVMAVKLVGGVQYWALSGAQKNDRNNINVSQKRMELSSSGLVLLKLAIQERNFLLNVAFGAKKRLLRKPFFNIQMFP